MTTPEQILAEFLRDVQEAPGGKRRLAIMYAEKLRSWASEVIGEDESYKNDGKMNMRLENYISRNELRSEQRQRAGIGEKS